MSTAQDELYQQLASELRTAFLDRLDHHAETGRDFYCHGYMGFPNELLAEIVLELGVARSALDMIPPKVAARSPDILIEPEILDNLELDKRLRGNGKDAPELSRVVEVYLAYFTYLDRLPNTRAEFSAPDKFTRALELLADAGYVERRADAWQWVDTVAPFMQACYAWTKDGRSCSDLRADQANRR